jgi:hypothetical protein
MRAISVRPPWAWAILHLGKFLENRSWSTDYRGPLLIHSSRTIEDDDFAALRRVVRKLGLDPDLVPEASALPRKAAVGICQLVDVVTQHGSLWFAGPHALVLDHVEPLPVPLPMNGKQKLWRVTRLE